MLTGKRNVLSRGGAEGFLLLLLFRFLINNIWTKEQHMHRNLGQEEKCKWTEDCSGDVAAKTSKGKLHDDEPPYRQYFYIPARAVEDPSFNPKPILFPVTELMRHYF